MFQDRTQNPVTMPKGRAAYNDRYPRDKVIGGLLLGTAVFMSGFLAGYDFKPANVPETPKLAPSPVPDPQPDLAPTPAPKPTPAPAPPPSVGKPFVWTPPGKTSVMDLPGGKTVTPPGKTSTLAPLPAKTVTTLAPLPVPTPEKEIQSILENVQQRATAPITSDAKMPTAPACQQPGQYQPAHRGFFGRRW